MARSILASRRGFLQGAGLAGLSGLLGCKPDRPLGMDDTGFIRSTPTGTPGCPDPFAGGTFLRAIPFDGLGTNPFGEIYNDGWDARRLFDLQELDGGSLEVPPEQFYIRTEYPDLLTTDPAAWIVRIEGLVDAPVDVPIADILDRTVDQGTILLECSGNGQTSGFGLMSAAQWAGAPLLEWIDAHVTRDPSATRALVTGFDQHSIPSENGHSTPGASWVFSIPQLQQTGAFLATELGGQPLPPDNGAPVRLLVPGWYGCTCIKWVTRVELVDDSVPATSQMEEFASRIHQDGTPPLAADYRSANQELSATAIRVEEWELDGEIAYRVVGIVWGGDRLVSALRIRLGNLDQPVSCFEHVTNRTWNLWSHKWTPSDRGSFAIALYVEEDVPQIRLDQGWYTRSVTL